MSSLAANLTRPTAKKQALAQDARTPGKMYWKRFRQSPLCLIGAFLLGLLIFLALFGHLLAPNDPILVNTADRFTAPGTQYFFGTDEFGRDIFSRILYGARIAVQVGLVSVFVAFFGGIVLGLISGYYGGWVDTVLSRLLEIWLSFPDILFVIAVVAILGPSLNTVILALGFLSIPAYARIVRGSVMSARQETYVEAARSVGVSNNRIMAKHILPNVVAPLIILSSMRFGSALLTGAGLSFIGLGAQPPTPEWGAILAGGRIYMYQAPWITVFPGLAIAIFVLGVNMRGDGLRDVLDPRLTR
ncbi:MAG TPA: ABC transporter permease [Thermomicrobiales bacterium]|nr:ABC transporter permease [Thermomicrobiales bacterium]